MEFGVLGPLEVVADGRVVQLPRPKLRALLARLLVDADRVVSVDRLIDDLWEGRPPEGALGTLQAHVSRLRRLLGRHPDGDPMIEARRPGYRLRVAPEELDSWRFEQLVSEGRAALARGSPAVAAERLTAALALWRGPAFGEFADSPFSRAEGARLEELRLAALEEHAEAGLAAGRHRELVGRLEALVAEHPLRERLWAGLMLALYRCGRQADALGVYQRLRRILGDELGIDPGPELVRLEQAILLQRPELDWARVAPPELPLPAPLAAAAESWLVGREAEREALTAVWKRVAAAGARRGVLVAGEAGVGKTRLVAELARVAHAQGAIVLYGRADEALDVAYGAFTEALRSWVASCSDEDLTALGVHGGQLSPVLPDLVRRLPQAPALPSADPNLERARLFEAVDALLARAAEAAPVLVVLDDLHWAARPTLLLVRQLMRSATAGPVAIVATHRPTERVGPLAELLADLRREPAVDRLFLSGLDRAGVVAYLEAASGADLDQAGRDLADALHAQTEGNPFFVAELLRHLVEIGAICPAQGRWAPTNVLESVGVPEGVREVVARRLSRLSPPACQILEVAAVAGFEFTVAVLEATDDGSGDDVLDALDEAVAARFVVEDPGRLGGYRFAHAVVRHCIERELTAARRARLHRRVGEALERLRQRDLDPYLDELAHHFVAAAPAGAAAKAVEYSMRAGNKARRLVAYEQAVAHFRKALDALELAGCDDGERCELLLAFGDAQWRAGEAGAASTFQQALELARSLADPGQLARAALGCCVRSMLLSIDPQLISQLEEALSGLPEGEEALRAKLLSRLAVELYLDPASAERRASLGEQAVAIARRLGDPATLAEALTAHHHAVWGPGKEEERLQVAGEVLALGERASDDDLVLQGHMWRLIALLETGDRPGVDGALAAYSALAERLRVPLWRYYARSRQAALALLEGQFDDAERLSREALVLGEQAQLGERESIFRCILAWIRMEQGCLGPLETALASFEELGVPAYPAFVRCYFARMWVEADRMEDARAIVDALADDDLERIVTQPHGLTCLVLIAEAVEALAAREHAAPLYAALAPHAQRVVVAGGAVQCLGPVAYTLGLLASMLDHRDEALSHLEYALALSHRLRARPWVARTQYHLARLRLPTDQDRGRALLAAAQKEAASLGMAGLQAQAAALLVESPRR